METLRQRSSINWFHSLQKPVCGGVGTSGSHDPHLFLCSRPRLSDPADRRRQPALHHGGADEAHSRHRQELDVGFHMSRLGTRLARHPAHQSDTEIERSVTTAHQGPMLDKDEWLASEAAAVGKCGLLPHFGCGNSVRSRDALRASCMSGGSREDGHALEPPQRLNTLRGAVSRERQPR